ncbi:chorismate-binding protein [Nafulsella turpanensis]|uniref:chorismate-binding protein n=1 Tax=Nafulsella turpanensis TaxID=1265690 RepID=UPI0003465041|nr:chorismate-binding protein [Nafulsella turpanensis]
MKEAEELLSEHFLEIPAEEALERLLFSALAEGLPVACWRSPGQQKCHLLIDLSGKARTVHPEVEKLPSGFVFTPYAADLVEAGAAESKQSLLLEAHLYLTTESGASVQLSPDLSPALQEKADALLARALEVEVGGKVLPYFVQPGIQASGTEKEQYCQLVAQAIQEVREGELQKVVCARKKEVKLKSDFQLLPFFRTLCQAYVNAFVSFVSIPEVGSWLGATPETLISINEQKMFRTMALAGTQPKSAAPRPAEAVWRQKEIEEQALVSRYIINCFKKIRLREFEEVGPRTVVAGNLMHLRTDFVVDMEATGFPALGSQMLELLHPTSAVCGMPRTEAKVFLNQHEQLSREFYAGFLGPVRVEGETHLYVNLRCMQLLQKEVILYAGAGITADSEPEREWQETEQKCATLAAFLGAE